MFHIYSKRENRMRDTTFVFALYFFFSQIVYIYRNRMLGASCAHRLPIARTKWKAPQNPFLTTFHFRVCVLLFYAECKQSKYSANGNKKRIVDSNQLITLVFFFSCFFFLFPFSLFLIVSCRMKIFTFRVFFVSIHNSQHRTFRFSRYLTLIAHLSAVLNVSICKHMA